MSVYFVPFLWMLVFYLPAVFLVLWLVRLKRQHVARARHPFTEKPLRLAGESTREKADSLWSSASEWMLMILIGCPILGFMFALIPTPSRTVTGVVGFIGVCTAAFFVGRRLKRDLSESWNYRLGALGEQVVGRELDKLIARGCQVFHDVPFDGWNIDHVVVSPHGVFAVETKSWRKPPRGGDFKAEMIYDGTALVRPGSAPDAEPIEQATRNAQSLSKWIKDAADVTVTAVPVVALPGWDLDIKRYGHVAVYSATNMSEHLLKRGKGQLTTGEIKRVAFQLAKQCGLETEG